MDKQEKDDEFFAVIKMISGEEVFARVQPCEEEDKTILILDSPVVFETIQIRQMGGVGAVRVNPWLEMAQDSVLVVNMDKVITLTEVHDDQVLRIYQRYLKDRDRDNRQPSANEDMGFLSSISDARIFLEKLYKSSDNPSEP